MKRIKKKNKDFFYNYRLNCLRIKYCNRIDKSLFLIEYSQNKNRKR